jgi:hypothetical protein
LVYPPEGTTPLIGSTDNDEPESGSPLILSFSKLNARGTYYKFFNETVYLFLPPSKRGPKFILPISKNMFGSTTSPINKKY